MPLADSLYLLLASGSPRRRELINLLEIPFTVIRPQRPLSGGERWVEIDETPLPDEEPAALVQRLSRQKAEAVVESLPLLDLADAPGGHPIILAADTTVVLGSEILNKPDDPTEAERMLRRLRQRSHFVYTGYTLAIPAQTVPLLPQLIHQSDTDLYLTRLHRSEVWMRSYTEADIAAYVAGGSPLDKAGAYGIQDEDFAPVARLDGCFASVMGLPLGDVATTLTELGLTLPAIGPLCRHFTGAVCCQGVNTVTDA